jgi:hypothetical protein
LFSTLLFLFCLVALPCCSPSRVATWLLTITTLLLASCYFAFHCCTLLLSLLRLNALPSCLATLPYYFAIMPYVHALLLYLVVCHTLLLTFFLGTSCHTPIFASYFATHFHALLPYFVNWYSLCRWRSLEQQQQVSSNNIGKKIPDFFCFIFVSFVVSILFVCFVSICYFVLG